jgi:hypothetical protein
MEGIVHFGEELYLLLVLATFASFAAVLAWMTQIGNKSSRPTSAN